MHKNRPQPRRGARAARQAAFGTLTLVGLVAQALAQTGPARETITVTGYAASVESSTRDKREATGFQDSIFAEDIGKFPDSNIAESLVRIPGVVISREITGEGLSISIRGLGSSFTKVLLNGAPIAVASTGRTDAQNTNREVDLDMFPTDLFTRLSVYKSPTAAMLEGGAAGVVDMRTARPFDKPGRNIFVNVSGVENTVADKWGNKGSILASNTWGSEFGILGGFAWGQNKIRTTGFETIGWTNANLSATQSTSATRNNTGGGNWTIPGTVPANAGNGLTTGATIDQALLLALNPGRTIQQIDNAIIPRLGRQMFEEGTKNRYSGVLSLEWRPSSQWYFYLDTLAGKKKNDMERVDMNWVGRNGAMIPLNMQVDRDDCSGGCVVTQATFANAQWFLEYRPFIETVKIWGANPGFEWNLGKDMKVDGQLNFTKSEFHRESPTALPITRASSGITVNYANGEVPNIASNVDLNNPANFIWDGGRVNQQQEFRETETRGGRINFTWGEKRFNVRAGLAYDDINREITARDNSGAWQAATCGNNPSVFLLGPNGAPPCNGASTPGASAAALYPGYGTGYTAGQTAPLLYQGSLIPLDRLATYLTPGPLGFVTVDWDRFAADSGYGRFVNTAPLVGSSNTGASAGFIQEKTTGFYAELNGASEPWQMPLKYNAGFRYVKTDQTVGGFVSQADPRNTPPAPAPALANGAKYPNFDQFVYLDSSYNNTLPSGTAALTVAKDFVIRGSASRTMTRPDPNAIRPSINFSSPSADVGTLGNTTLTPFLSDNVDLGFEWYTGGSGYVSATPFFKRIKGFTTNQNTTLPFAALAAYGVTYDSLSPTQQAALNTRGGPTQATVVITQQVNAEGYLKIKGLELGWVQPLNMLPIRGFGFSANYTRVNQSATGAGAVALGVPETTYNATGYYEQHGVMLRLSYTWQEGSQSAGFNQNGIPSAALFTDDYGQADFSSYFDLSQILNKPSGWWPVITFDVTNLTKEKQRSYFQFQNATFTQYAPGSTYMLGLRLKF